MNAYTDTPGLTCDADHLYHFGSEIPLGVSEVMEDNRLESGKWFDESDSSRGRAIHAALALYARGKTRDDIIIWGELDEDLHGWFRSGADFLDMLRSDGAVILGVEVMRHHPLYRFAGTLDLVVFWRGYEWIIDHKSGKASRVTRFKLAAYDSLLGPTPNGLPRKRAAVELDRDGGRARLVEYNTPEHFHDANRFLSYLNTSRDRKIYAPKDA
jgi:hypothetical protein